MIKRLGLQNFQGVREFTEIEFAPLTLIFGTNSSGKTTLFRALDFLKQTALSTGSPTDKVLPSFEWSGDHVNLGGFSTSVHGHDNRRTMRLLIDVGLKESEGIGIDLSIEESPGQVASLSAYSFRAWDSRDQGQLRYILQEDQFQGEPAYFWSLVPENSNPEALSQILSGMVSREESSRGARSTESLRAWPGYHGNVRKSRQRRDGSFVGMFSDHWVHSLRNLIPSMVLVDPAHRSDTDLMDWFFEEAREALVTQFNRLTHIGANRKAPERLERVVNSALSVDADGTNAISALANDLEASRKVGAWISKLTQGNYSFDVQQVDMQAIPGSGEFVFAELTDNRNGASLSLQDVGSGFPYLLPILTALALCTPSLAPNPTVLIEQPELHLHPQMQGDLADVLLDFAKDGWGQAIVETHSEALLMRIQKRIRERRIDPSLVKILFVENTVDFGTEYIPMRLDLDGSFLDSWPTSFLDLRLDDLI